MITRRQVWVVYLLMACQGYAFYGVGYLTPYVETELGAPAWASVLPMSTMAVGLLAASLIVPRVVHALGLWVATRAWALGMAAGSLLVALGGSLPVILVGALVTGLSTAGALTHVVTVFAGRRNGVLLMRATLASVIGGVAGPLVLSAAARSIGWNLGLLVPVPFVLLLALLATGGAGTAAEGAGTAAEGHAEAPVAAGDDAGVRARTLEPPLTRAYWLAWGFLVLCIGAESSFVAWGAQVAVLQAGISLADATALGALFVLGEILGRVALGTGGGVRMEPRRMLALMTAVGLAGGLLVWVGVVPAIAGAGLLLGGLGIAGIWPTAAGLAVANAPRSPIAAGARLNLATGVAVLVVPFVLGVVATLTSVLGAWAIVLGLLSIALAVLRTVPRARPAAAAAA